MNYKLVGWLLVGWIAADAALARIPATPLFRQLGANEGLASNHVHKLAQDRAGYLWVATNDGLARFDGVSFRIWQHDPSDPTSLPANVVQALHVDAEDRVWVGTEGGGLSLMDADRSGFRNYRAPLDPRFTLDDVFAILSTPDGSLWLGGYGGGLQRYDPRSDELRVFKHDAKRSDSIASDHVLSLALDDAGMLWIGTMAGLDRRGVADAGDRFEHIGGLSGSVIPSLYAEPNGPLWIGSTTGGLDLRERDGRVHAATGTEELSKLGVFTMTRDRRGSLWIGTRSGLRHLVDDQLLSYTVRTDRHVAVEAASVMDSLEDHEGGLWFATLGGGLQRLPPNWRDFAVLLRDSAERGGLGRSFPRGLTASRAGGLWAVGAGEAIDQVQPDGTVTRHLEEKPKLPGKQLWSVLEDASGVVWVGHHDGLSRYDPARLTLQTWDRRATQDAPPGGPIDLLAQAPDGRIWLSGLSGGLQQRALGGRVLATFVPGEASGLLAADTEQIEFAPDGTLWLAGAGGLHRFDAAQQRFVPVPGAPTDRVFAFDFEPGGLWLQRLGALERYRLEVDGLHRVISIGTEQGLPAVEAGGLRLDATGSVWLTTTRGLLRYRTDRGELRLYGRRDGLPSQEFNNRPMLRLPDGSIAASTVDGLVWFDPSQLREERSVPRLHMESVSVRRDDEVVNLDPKAALELRHEDRELRFHARLMSFADPGLHRFRFRLRGYETDWIDTGADGERAYPQLPPGDYRLEAVAANADAVWSAPPLGIDIRVAPPWWATWWARSGFALAALLVLATLAHLYRSGLRRRHAAQLAQRQHEWTQRASEAKSSFLATLGHEIRTPMTGVLGMAELLLRTPLAERQRGYAESIQRSGDLLLKLVNDALDLARIEAGKLELADAPLDLAALVRDVATLHRPLAEAKGLAYTLHVASDAPTWVRGDGLRLQQILLNLGNNAIKFTEHGEVALELRSDSPPYTFAMALRDTGPGLNAEQRARLFQRFSQADGADTARRYGGSGLGLAICQELTSAMQGRIDLQSEPGQGTTFVVRLPLPICEPVDMPSSRVLAPARTVATKRILLVEDDATVAIVVQGLLAMEGHHVVHAAHGLAALTELARERYDLAFVDLDLPGVNGLDLARMITAQKDAPALIALSARADPEAEPQALAAGMKGFLRKPVSGGQLAEVVEFHCSASVDREPGEGPHVRHPDESPHYRHPGESPDVRHPGESRDPS